MGGRRIAVIGGGAGGLAAAYSLPRAHRVTLFEAEGRLGGHAHTHLVEEPSGQALRLDTGFLVYNERTYPMLSRMLSDLGVRTQETEMSLSFRCRGCGLQYAGNRGLAAGPGRGGRRYLRLLAEVLRFHAEARRLLGRVRARRAWPDPPPVPLRERLLGVLHLALCHAVRGSRLVMPAEHGDELPGRVPVHLPGAARTAVGNRRPAGQPTVFARDVVGLVPRRRRR
jgi:glycine/D-amino acid oxidase-like deaminating enzyme